MSRHLAVALDLGSTSARAVLVEAGGGVVAQASRPTEPLFPQRGWVELDPWHLWRGLRDSLGEALTAAGATTDDIAGAGVTTSRETCLLWDRATGEPVYPAIMWMSKQTDEIVERWRNEGLDDEFRSRTGLFNDSFFSAAKLAWILEKVPGARARAEAGELAAGTLDSWLVWNLTGRRSHATDPSEASRTALFSLTDLAWDEVLCSAAGVPLSVLPEVLPSDGVFGEAHPSETGLPGSSPFPITAVMGDQMAGMFGQGCLASGSVKNTFGTAGVLTANTGDRPAVLEGLTASVAWTLEGTTHYEAEGVVFHSGQTLHWMREKLELLGPDERSEEVASRVTDSCGVYVVPAFAGLCAPHWARDASASIVGLTLESTRAHVVRAGLEAMAYQTRDNVEAFRTGGYDVRELRVDGGATTNELLCQFQADILGVPVVRPRQLEQTAMGIAHVAGVAGGLWKLDDLAARWEVDRVFEPTMSEDQREGLYAGWQAAVRTVTGGVS
ncbi:glycerol kinase [Nocardioides psychrotolerans]|uniref:Glycerol kinase n=1 Tax=Nocardioides psychrotolerans TaxID=1005945 RepID=A0A1I3HKS9_9ACTN|nr:glycerol kinase GlpK [Nocardioides psychrotolerans]GEP40011.1 glycerol kinase [Nocardioides psychrotolerans]SFI36252.1 glycerol kinase [Nocardioides psychrotolerans]